MSTRDAKVIGWTKEKALLGMKASIAKRWEAVTSPKCVLYYAFPYRRADGGRGLGLELKALLHSILRRWDVVFITAADCHASMSDADDVRLITTLVCDLKEGERDTLLSQPSWSYSDLTVFVHPWYPSSDFDFVGLLRGSESPNDTKLLKRDLTDAIGIAHIRGHNNNHNKRVRAQRSLVYSIDVLPSIQDSYRAVYVDLSAPTPEQQKQDMATLRTMTYNTVLGTQTIFLPKTCDLCLGVDHSLTYCPFKRHITHNLPLDNLSESSKRRRSSVEDEPDTKRVKLAESSYTEL